jgi:oxygen-independent coproporphyrinogen-3 oxidase
MDILNYLDQNRYAGYSYSYPHKLSYRRFTEPVRISNAWENENKQSLFLYIHIPFCEMRCSFCNLFTLPHPSPELIDMYIEKLRLQASVVANELGQFNISRVAIGGGTPTILNTHQLSAVFNLIKEVFHVDFKQIPCSIECSPATVSDEKIQFLKEMGVSRVSIGIQSFLENETRKMGRPDSIDVVNQALTRIRDAQFPQFNIDLIYGYINQTAQTLEYSLECMDQYQNNEVFLYPLYVRPLTACSKTLKQWEDNRNILYEAGRDLLENMGFKQMSMRFFKKEENNIHAVPEYCCQQDGMIGLGAGARSYTRNLHYSFEYAVSRKSTENIIQKYCGMEYADFENITYGISLNLEEQKRRVLIKSLLHIDGLNRQWYASLYNTDVLTDFPVLEELQKLGFCEISSVIQLTRHGISYSDAIGPFFYSAAMKRQMDLFQLT